jgi:hypothetical protein
VLPTPFKCFRILSFSADLPPSGTITIIVYAYQPRLLPRQFLVLIILPGMESICQQNALYLYLRTGCKTCYLIFIVTLISLVDPPLTPLLLLSSILVASLSNSLLEPDDHELGITSIIIWILVACLSLIGIWI